MRIEVATTPAEFGGADEHTAAVVIDVFRTSTTITTALASGARFVLPAADVEQAVRLRGPYAESEAVLGGERDCRRIEGFHLGNSPREYAGEIVANKVIIMTTTNGTRALFLARDAGAVFVGCFLNSRRLAQALLEWPRVAIICAGNAGRLSLEDLACAGALVHQLVAHVERRTASEPAAARSRPRARLNPDLSDPALNDGAWTAWAAYLETRKDNFRLLRTTEHARHLAELGFAVDLESALRVDSLPVIPRLADGRIELLPDTG